MKGLFLNTGWPESSFRVLLDGMQTPSFGPRGMACAEIVVWRGSCWMIWFKSYLCNLPIAFICFFFFIVFLPYLDLVTFLGRQISFLCPCLLARHYSVSSIPLHFWHLGKPTRHGPPPQPPSRGPAMPWGPPPATADPCSGVPLHSSLRTANPALPTPRHLGQVPIPPTAFERSDAGATFSSPPPLLKKLFQ